MKESIHIVALILVTIAVAQDNSSGDNQVIHDGNNQGYSGEVVTEWTEAAYHNPELNAECVNGCKRTCVNPCPVAHTCNDDQIKCGEKDHPEEVWPDCIKDEICVPSDCECKLCIFIFWSNLGEYN